MFQRPVSGKEEEKFSLLARSVLRAALFLCLACLVPHLLAPVAAAASAGQGIARGFRALGIQESQKSFAGLKPVAGSRLKESYEQKKVAMDELRQHKTRSCWRQPWEELRDAFLSIAASSPYGNQAAQALFRAGQCQEELARCSHTGRDARLALDLYGAVAKTFAKSVRADDALLACAILSSEKLKRSADADRYLAEILERFPASDSAPRARELRAQLKQGKTLARTSAGSGTGTVSGSATVAAGQTRGSGQMTVTRARLSAREIRAARAQKAGRAVQARAKTVRRAKTNLYAQSPIRVVTIDAGHGGIDPGTLNNGVVERSITLDVALRVGRILADNGMRVVYTRTRNKTVSLARRTEIANASKSDLFVSVHVNANTNRRISGLEVYYLDSAASLETLKVAARGKRNKKTRARLLAQRVALNERVLESRTLARDVLRQMKREVRKNGFVISSKGIKSAPFYVLSTSAMPAVLAEIGYCTNLKDAKLLKDPDFRQAVAEGIASGVLAYRDRAAGLLTAEKGGRTLQ